MLEGNKHVFDTSMDDAFTLAGSKTHSSAFSTITMVNPA